MSTPRTKSKQPPSTEYRLLIAPHFNERKQKYTTRVVLETVKSFASFRYELTVRETITDNAIRYEVLGLNAPQLNLPASGPASFANEYDALTGTYTVSVEGLDGKTSSGRVRITPTKVIVLKGNHIRPLEIVTDERSWTNP